MKMKKVVALLSTMAMCGSFIIAVPASADTVVSSWDFDAMDVGKFSTEVTDTDMYAVPRGGSISVMDMDAENSTVPKTVGDGSLANPSGKVLRIDSSATSGNEVTGNAYVELPASLFFDGTTTDDTTTYALKETVAISYDLYSGTQGWRYGFFAGNSLSAGISFIPNGPDSIARVLSNNNATDGIPVPLNEWHHIDVVKTLSPEGNYEIMKTYLDGVLVTGVECYDFSNSDVFARIGYSPYGDVGADFYIDNITVSDEIPYSEDYAVSEIYTHTGFYENSYENAYISDGVNAYEINDTATYHRIYVKPENISDIKRIALSCLGTYWGDPIHVYAYATSAEIKSVEELEAADLTTASYTNLGSTSFTKRFVWGYGYPEISVSNIPEDANGLIIEYCVSNNSGVYESGCYLKTLALYSSEATTEPTDEPEETAAPEPTEEPETIYNAYVGETGYETLDAALAAENEVRDESYTIVLKADQELTSVGNYSGAHITTTITSDDTRRKITLNPSTDGATFTYDIVVFDNVEMVSSTTCENDLWCIAAFQRSGNRYFTVNNSYLHDIVVTDCLSVFTQNNVTNSTVENNTAPAAIFSNRTDSLIENSTITNNTATNLGAVEVVGGTTKIKNSTITGTVTNRGDVSALGGGTLRLEGETVIGSIYYGGGTIVLGSDFTGSAAVKNLTVADGTVVATVEDGADVSEITVEGMDESAYELVVRNGQLVIVSKNAVNLVTETTYVNSRDYSAETGVETNKATGFATKITNTGTANGLFKTISWTVTSNGESKTSDKFDMGTEITLAPEAYVHVGFVVGNLCDASATAEATVFAE